MALPVLKGGGKLSPPCEFIGSPFRGRVQHPSMAGQGRGPGVKRMKPWAKQFYKSKAWRECRDAFFASKYGLCERCGKPGVIVHHKIKLTPNNINDPTVTLNWDNLELLCIECHNREHGNASTAEGLTFDENGDLIYTPLG